MITNGPRARRRNRQQGIDVLQKRNDRLSAHAPQRVSVIDHDSKPERESAIVRPVTTPATTDITALA